MSLPLFLTQETLEQGVEFLSAVDPDLRRVVQALGQPPLWARKPGFPALVHIILEQQVSLASARAAMSKLEAALPEVTPQAFLTLTDEELKAVGFSRQKTSYCRGAAQAILQDELDLEGLASLDDPAARDKLMQIKGVGSWTADIYLLIVLLRPDVWPAGDLALVSALQELKGLETRPNAAAWEQIALPWRPWRAVAARLLWHYYLRPRSVEYPL